jgi:hypothetical protein
MSHPNLANVEMYLEDTLAPTDPGYLPPLVFQPSYGFVPQGMNQGFPEVRDNVTKRPSQDGTFDFTEFLGARSVTLNVALSPETSGLSERDLEDQLRRWMHPSRRSWLYVQSSGGSDFRRIYVRPSTVASSMNFITNRNFRTVSLSWKAANGVWEGAELQMEELEAGTDSETGRTYDETYDKTYPASDVVGEKTVYNYGTAPAFPIARIYGPVTQPRIENKTTNKRIIFTTGLVIAAGEYLEINFAEGTATMNGNINNSRYQFLDFAGGLSEWWSLIPGANKLRFYPGTYTPPGVAIFEWRSAYL